MHVTFSRRRARQVFDPMIRAYRRQQHPYNGTRPAHAPENLPKRFGSRRFKALYFFFACLFMRAGNRSEYPLRQLTRLFEDRRELFDPQVARRIRPRQMTQILQLYGLEYKAKEFGRSWVENADRLCRWYGGNPLRIFDGISSFEELYERLCHRGDKGFWGFQEKVSSLFMHFYVDVGLIPPFMFPSPTDEHSIRVVMETGIGKLRNREEPIYYKRLLPGMRDLFVWYCTTKKVAPGELAEAMFQLSRNQCDKHPGNSLQQIGPKDGERTILLPIRYSWDEYYTAVYEETCGQCPIERFCLYNVPLKRLKTTGKVLANRLRDKPPNQEVPF